MFGDPDDYYYVDDQGNLIEPGQGYGLRDSDPSSEPLDPQPNQLPQEGLRPLAPGIPEEEQAADDDFLEQAIGRPLAPDNPPAVGAQPQPAPN